MLRASTRAMPSWWCRWGGLALGATGLESDHWGWLPTIDTVASLLSANTWRHAAGKGRDRISGDAVADRIQAGQKLVKESWARQWASRDPRGFEHAMEQVVQAAHDWVKRAQAIPPAQRSAYWQEARGMLACSVRQCRSIWHSRKAAAGVGPGWVIDSFEAGWPSDALFEMAPKAWIGVSAGPGIAPGTEAHLMLSLLADAQRRGIPCRWDVACCDTDGFALGDEPARLGCSDSEDEARHAAAVVLNQVQASRAKKDGEPVALIALDRSLIRRVQAMLDGAGATVADETGWRLSTARAAAVLTRLLVARIAAGLDRRSAGLDQVWLAEFGRIGCRRCAGGLVPSARLATRLG